MCLAPAFGQRETRSQPVGGFLTGGCKRFQKIGKKFSKINNFMKKKKKDCIFEPKRKKDDRRSFKRFQDSLRWNKILKDLLRNFKISKDFQKLAQDIESTWPRLFVKLLVTLLATMLATFKRKNDNLKEKMIFKREKRK